MHFSRRCGTVVAHTKGYMHVHVYSCTYEYTRIPHTLARASHHTHGHMYTIIHVHIHTHTNVHIYSFTRTHARTSHAHVPCLRTREHGRHARTHAHAHTHTRARTHAHASCHKSKHFKPFHHNNKLSGSDKKRCYNTEEIIFLIVLLY